MIKDPHRDMIDVHSKSSTPNPESKGPAIPKTAAKIVNQNSGQNPSYLAMMMIRECQLVDVLSNEDGVLWYAFHHMIIRQNREA
jgi:hypothetical protein